MMVGLTPTTQRVEGYPYGECVRASYATLLDLPIELVPRFDPGALLPGEPQAARERTFVALLGATLGVPLALVESPPVPLARIPADVRAGYHLISGISPRGFGHRCVGLHGRVVWDPHPSRAGLSSITSVGFLVPR